MSPHDMKYKFSHCVWVPGQSVTSQCYCCCRDLLKKSFQKNAVELQVLEAAELFLYCFHDVEAVLSAHTCLADLTPSETANYAYASLYQTRSVLTASVKCVGL